MISKIEPVVLEMMPQIAHSFESTHTCPPINQFLWEARIGASIEKCPTNTWRRNIAPYLWAQENGRAGQLGGEWSDLFRDN